MAYLEDIYLERMPNWLLKPFASLMRTVRWIVLWLERDPRYKLRGRRPPGQGGPNGWQNGGDRSPLVPRSPHLSGAAARGIPRQ